MLVKEWELSNYKKSLNDFNAILIYGTDRGKVSAIAQSLVTFSKSVYFQTYLIYDQKET